MLAFVDESGDTGRRITNNSSRYLVVAIAVFSSNDDAQACDDAIRQLRVDLNLRSTYEFHYAHNSTRVKEAFLNRVSPYQFDYCAFAINKDSRQMSNAGLEYGDSLYRFAILRTIELVAPYLDNAIVTIDNSGERRSKERLSSHLRQNLRSRGRIRNVGKIKMQDSATNNLLQLADYVAGIMNRSLQGRQREANYVRRYLIPHEIRRVMWPDGQGGGVAEP